MKTGLYVGVFFAVFQSVAAGAIVPLQGALVSYSQAYLGDYGGNDNREDGEWFGVPESLSLGTGAIAENIITGSTLSSYSFIDADWADETAGTIALDFFGATIEANRLGEEPGNFFVVGIWSYTFTAERDGEFLLDWGFQLAKRSSEEYRLSFGGIGGPERLFGDDLSRSSGSLLRRFGAGNTYEITVSAYSGDANIAPGVYDVGFSGSLSWSLREDAVPPTIPEPASWILMVSGFGLLGGVVRRRRVMIQQS